MHHCSVTHKLRGVGLVFGVGMVAGCFDPTSGVTDPDGSTSATTTGVSSSGDPASSDETSSGSDSTVDDSTSSAEDETCFFDVSMFDDGCVFGP